MADVAALLAILKTERKRHDDNMDELQKLIGMERMLHDEKMGELERSSGARQLADYLPQTPYKQMTQARTSSHIVRIRLPNENLKLHIISLPLSEGIHMR